MEASSVVFDARGAVNPFYKSRLLPVIIVLIVIALILARLAASLWLEHLNRRHVQAHAGGPPEAVAGVMDKAAYARSVEYTLARSRFSEVEKSLDAIVLLAALFSGLLPWLQSVLTRALGEAAWAQAAFVLTAGFLISLPGLPLDWHEQFHLEHRFGFNTTTPATWWADRLKSFLVLAVLGWPLLALVLELAERAGPRWWLWAWASWVAFQLLVMILAPVLILPLFNQLTPLPEGGLRERLLKLAERTGFQTRGIQVMDGSRRSRHSNAFFTGFGRFRRIVLFDTLVGQLNEAELESVLAHEIGHYKLGHMPKMLALSAGGSLVSFRVLAWLAEQMWFAEAFGFGTGQLAPVLLVFGLLGGTLAFWISPAINGLSRRHEFQADAFAARTVGNSASLVAALRKLSRENLSNLTPHPCYSAFHHSHPTLPERERALANAVN